MSDGKQSKYRLWLLVLLIAIGLGLSACGLNDPNEASSKDTRDMTFQVRLLYGGYDHTDPNVLSVIDGMTNGKWCDDAGFDRNTFDKPCLVEIGGWENGPWVIWWGPEAQ